MKVRMRLRRMRLPVLYEQLDRSVAELREHIEGEGEVVSCREGCTNCCYQRILATDVEVRAIVDHLRARSRPGALIDLRRRAVEQLARVRAIRQRHYYHLREPCVFLDLEKQRCTVYVVRPVVCRLHLSVDNPQKCAGDLGSARVVNVHMLSQLAAGALGLLGADPDATLGDPAGLTDDTYAELAPQFAARVIAAIDEVAS